MLNFLSVNFLAVLVAGIVFMVVGFLWYSPVLFAKPWTALNRMTEEQIRQASSNSSPLMYLPTFIGALVSSYILSVFIHAAQMTTLLGGLEMGFLAALGFIIPSFGSNYVFSSRPFKLYLIDAGYQVVSLTLAGMILGVWR
jgi:hypothetical protein